MLEVDASELVRPAHLWVPDHVSSAGGEASDLMELAGFTLDAEQRLALDALLAEKATGKWAALVAVVIAARQNLKTFLFKAVALSDLYLFDLDLVVWTAHEFNTAMEAFRDVKEIVEGVPYFSRRVKRITEANGDEGIEFMTGQRLRFKARTKVGGKGLTGDRVILDEGFALRPAHMGSLMPTMSAKSITGNPQILVGSSAGYVDSDVLRDMRDRGRKGGDPSLTWVEWCAPEGGCELDDCDHQRHRPNCALDDREKIRLANPALDRRISWEFIQAERLTMTVEEFARERLGWWEDPVEGDSGIPVAQWNACKDRDAVLDERVTLALDVSPGHLSAAIVACGGPVHVAEHGRGTTWVVPTLLRLLDEHDVSAVGLDPTGPASALIEDLQTPVEDGGAGLTIRGPGNEEGRLVLLGGSESCRACEGLLSDIVDGSFVHRDQGVLNDAVDGAGRRQVGDSWKWSRRDSTVDITPLVAATVARFLYVQPGLGAPAPFAVWA